MTIKEMLIERQAILDKSERLVLDRLCGALVNMQVLLDLKKRALKMEAGLPPDEPSTTCDGQNERVAALALIAMLQRNLADNYPEPWDEIALGDAVQTFEKEQLLFDLRQRVRAALARAFR